MDQYCYEEELSPTDTSEDSIEISVKQIHKKFSKNKRKSAEPKRMRLATDGDKKVMTNMYVVADYNDNNKGEKRKCPTPSQFSHLAPKKRFKMDALLDLEREQENNLKHQMEDRLNLKQSPFRPWTAAAAAESRQFTRSGSVSPTSSSSCVSPVFAPSALSPVLLEGNSALPLNLSSPTALLLQFAALKAAGGNLPAAVMDKLISSPLAAVPAPEQDEPLSLVVTKEENTVKENKIDSVPPAAASPLSASSSLPSTATKSSPVKKQTNYKSKTRDRRVEANARERKRVHTITAAFDTLQSAIPTENQEKGVKLSKLSVIKIATAYIMALSRMAGYDYTEDQSAPSLHQVIQQYHQTVSEETKVKCRKS